MVGISRLAFSLALVCWWSSQSIADDAKPTNGPFGIIEGTELSALSDCRQPTPTAGVYRCSDVPKPRPGIAWYGVLAGAHVCGVLAGTSEKQVDNRGDQIRELVDRAASEIAKEYGAYTKLDELAPGSMWAGPDHWMEGLFTKERVYDYVWRPEAGSKLKDGINWIIVSAKAPTLASGYAFIFFIFDNHADCDSVMTQP